MVIIVDETLLGLLAALLPAMPTIEHVIANGPGDGPKPPELVTPSAGAAVSAGAWTTVSVHQNALWGLVPLGVGGIGATRPRW
jgi:hypothetical protein